MVVETFAYGYVNLGLLRGRADGRATDPAAARSAAQLQQLVVQVQMRTQVRVVQTLRGARPSMSTRAHGQG